MTLEFMQVDVFADNAYAGNPLAVFHDAPDLSGAQMQAIAREMNLSETTFVTKAAGDSYSMRIFTPSSELGFAGHPTLGTTWVLKRLGRVSGETVTQTTEVGATPVVERDGKLWFERQGAAEEDLGDDPATTARLAGAIGLEPRAIGLEARELGRSGRLRPAFSSGGFRQLMVPVRDLDALASCAPRPDELAEIGEGGAYCFTAVRAGHVQARGFFPGFGVAEDPATGSAAASLGAYLASRLGDVDIEIAQGVEMGRPSRIFVRGRAAGSVEVGGACEPVFTGRLERLP